MSVTPDQNAVRRQVHGSAKLNGHGHRIGDGLASRGVPDLQDFGRGSACRLLPRPACHCFRDDIEEGDVSFDVSANNGIANGVERDLGAFLLLEQRFFHELAVDGMPQRSQQSGGVDWPLMRQPCAPSCKAASVTDSSSRPVSTTKGTRGAAARTRRTASSPCASGNPRSSKMISTPCCARYVSASVRRFTCVNSVLCAPPRRASRGANGRLRGCLRPAEPFGSIPWSSASRLMRQLGLYQPELVAALREASQNLAAIRLWKVQSQRDKVRS